jgi:ABC-type transport system involved in multi-copper enzyme maturation permease subunit
VSRTRTLLTKYSVGAVALFGAALFGGIAAVISGSAHGYPAGSFSAVEILASAGLFWLGSLLVLGVALLASVLFGDVMKSVVAALVALYAIFSASSILRTLTQWLFWTDEDFERSPQQMNGWFDSFERFNLFNYWTAENVYTGEWVASQAAQNALVCLAAASVPLLAALWLFRRKEF